MAKFLIASTVFPVIFLVLLGGFFAVPAHAQDAAIKERCVLSRNIDVEIPFQAPHSSFLSIVSIKEGSFISPQIKSGGIANGGVDVKFKFKPPSTSVTDYRQLTAITETAAISALESKWGVVCLVNTINSATNWIFFVLISVSFVMILIAGFMWVTGGTNAENQKKTMQMIVAALVGIVIALLSRIIPGIVIGILT